MCPNTIATAGLITLPRSFIPSSDRVLMFISFSIAPGLNVKESIGNPHPAKPGSVEALGQKNLHTRQFRSWSMRQIFFQFGILVHTPHLFANQVFRFGAYGISGNEDTLAASLL
jgi:hypothetical protein